MIKTTDRHVKALNDLLGRKANGRPCVPTLNFLIGDRSCNMSCRYCISKMTEGGLGEFSPLWYTNQPLAFSVAKKYDSDTVLITSKGEPTLWRQQVCDVISRSRNEGFIVELQTNGGLLDDNYCKVLAYAGLNTIALSRVYIDTEANNEICDPIRHRSPDLYNLIAMIHRYGMNARLCFVAMENCFDTPASVIGLCQWASKQKVKQVTLRRMGMPNFNYLENSDKAQGIYKFVSENIISNDTWKHIIDFLMANYRVLRVFDWGSISWAVEGVQLLIADCLTVPGPDGTIRYLIYCPDGHLRYSWEHDCTIIF
jgi:pyruvate-formate lyase-activating enzyme